MVLLAALFFPSVEGTCRMYARKTWEVTNRFCPKTTDTNFMGLDLDLTNCRNVAHTDCTELCPIGCRNCCYSNAFERYLCLGHSELEGNTFFECFMTGTHPETCMEEEDVEAARLIDIKTLSPSYMTEFIGDKECH
jgi:hypothetical protein